MQIVRSLLDNPESFLSLRNETLAEPRVYRGSRAAEAGVVGKIDRTGNFEVVDTDGTAIPRCAAVSLLYPELVRAAVVLERSWAQSFLHCFPSSSGVGVQRRGHRPGLEVCEGRYTQVLTTVGGRKAFLYWGRHQSKVLGDAKALESGARGDVELHRVSTNGAAVSDAAVDDGMRDIVGGVIGKHVELREETIAMTPGGATSSRRRARRS